MDELATMALKKATSPKTQVLFRSFLVLCNVYKRFVPRFLHVAAPLNELFVKVQPVNLAPFDGSETNSFNALVEAIASPLELVLPKKGHPWEIYTDASDYQVGAALFQVEEDRQRNPNGFWSRSLLAAEKKYSTPEKECVAIFWALQALRPYLQGEKFVFNTDHSALRWLLTIR